jgi:O-antigen/teichoic acid export membrane protein
MPRASYCIEKGQYDEFVRLITKALKFVFVAAIPLFVFFTLFAEDGILFLSGRAYMAAIPAMKVITPTVLFIGVTGLIGVQIFVPLGKEKYVLYSELAGAITDLILNMILIPRLQSTGAAIGTLVAEFVVLIVQLWFLVKIRKEIPIVRVFKRIKYWKILVSCLLASGCSIWVNLICPVFFVDEIVIGNHSFGVDMINSFLRLLIAAVIYFGVYIVFMIVVKDDMMIEIVNTVLKRLNRKETVDV